MAGRSCAGPGSKAYGRFSILARLYGSVELYRTVPAEAFVPRPEVESRLAVHVAHGSLVRGIVLNVVLLLVALLLFGTHWRWLGRGPTS